MVWRNNWFLLKLMCNASPSFLIFTVLDTVRHSVSVFFEHIWGIGYILEAAEFQYPFWQVARFILLLAVFVTLGMIFSAVTEDYIKQKERPKVKEQIKMLLYEKTKELDLACYDDPAYYNEMVLAVSEVDKQIDRCEIFIKNAVSGITVFITSGLFSCSGILFPLCSWQLLSCCHLPLINCIINYPIRCGSSAIRTRENASM